MKNKDIELEINNCARCGGNHKSLCFKRFKRKLQDNMGYNYWSTCPTTNEPILMKIIGEE